MTLIDPRVLKWWSFTTKGNQMYDDVDVVKIHPGPITVFVVGVGVGV